MTPKEIDLIQKLIRLANNNPNENEANSAARRVCRMLENYKFSESITTQRSSQPASEQNPNGRNPFEEIFRKAREQRTQEYRTHEYDIPFWKPSQAQEDFLNNNRVRYSGIWNEEPKPRPESKLRTCMSCGNIVSTKKITQIFVCDMCEWSAYHRNKNPDDY